MRIAMSSGHSTKCQGAIGPNPWGLNEVNEATRVVDKTAEFIRAAGVQCETYHDTISTSQNENLNRIVDWHNGRGSHDLDVSVHFNAYQSTTTKAMGTECLYVTQQSLSAKVSAAIAEATDLPNRGAKYRSDLFFLNSTVEPAILIEVVFVDSKIDADSYRANFNAVCEAIAEAIVGVDVPNEIDPPDEIEEPPPETEQATVDIQIQARGNVRVTINGQDVYNGEPAADAIPSYQQNIIATVFKDAQTAYGGPPMNDTELSVSLPWRFDSPPRVECTNRATGKKAIGQVRDVGPWMTDDNYPQLHRRPMAETCYLNNAPLPSGPHAGVVPNGAGIDLSPGLARAIGISGKGKVDWRIMD